MSELLVIKDKVGIYIKEMFDQVSLGDSGDFVIPYGSVVVLVKVLENTDQEIVKRRKEFGLPIYSVNVLCPVLLDVKPSNDLFKWIATEGQIYDYGSFKFDYNEEDKNKGSILYEYIIAADTFDAKEVKNAVICVASTSNTNYENLKKMFGGTGASDNN
jgi:hypothetical protein